MWKGTKWPEKRHQQDWTLLCSHMQSHIPLARPFVVHIFDFSHRCFHGFVKKGHQRANEDLNIR